MNRLFRPTVVAALIASTSAMASANVEVGGTPRIDVFSDTNELGVPDVADAPSQRNSALFGLRVGLFFTDLLGVEAELGMVPSEPRTDVLDIWNLTYRAHLMAQFGAGDPAKKLIPFVLLGGGAFQVAHTHNADVIEKDTDSMIYAGLGAKYRVDNGWGLRADARAILVPTSKDDGVTTDFELLLSIYKEFGRTTVEKVIEAPVDEDPDKDGISGAADGCPQEPEDKDRSEERR